MGVKLLEHGMTTILKMLERRFWSMVKMSKMEFGFMPKEQGAI